MIDKDCVESAGSQDPHVRVRLRGHDPQWRALQSRRRDRLAGVPIHHARGAYCLPPGSVTERRMKRFRLL